MNEKIMNELVKLINDEAEAIDGYNQAIKLFTEAGLSVDTLEHIRDEEYEHMYELNAIQDRMSK